MFACYGILGALFERERSGRGHRVEVNMLEAGIAFIPDPFANYTRAGIVSDRLTRVAASQIVRVPLRRRQAHRHPPVVAAEVLRGDRRGAGAPRSAARRAVRHPRPADQELRRAEPRTRRDHCDQAAHPLDDCARSARRAFRAGPEPAGRARRSAGASSRTFYRQRHPTEGEITAIHRPVLIDGAREERAVARARRSASTPRRCWRSSAMMRTRLPSCGRHR